ncbi:MAG: PEGA domain-containing protein [Deltaproteobacteria bacterium]|nr:PEGA domain-containing protein [Deltaproteobacteria bacterium]
MTRAMLILAAFLAGEVSLFAGQAKKGWLVVRSDTGGAQVEIDDLFVGQIPLNGPLALPVGRHALKVAKPGYTQYLDIVRIRPGRTTTVSVDLLPVAGILHVTSNVKGARVLIDGRFVGRAPLSTEAMIGQRRVRVEAGARSSERRVRMVAGETLRLRFELVDRAVPDAPQATDRAQPWHKRWYLWAAAAVVVAAGVSLAVVASRRTPIERFSPDHHFRSSALLSF